MYASTHIHGYKLSSNYRVRVMGYDVQHHMQQYFNYIVEVSFIGGGNQSTW